MNFWSCTFWSFWNVCIFVFLVTLACSFILEEMRSLEYYNLPWNLPCRLKDSDKRYEEGRKSTRHVKDPQDSRGKVEAAVKALATWRPEDAVMRFMFGKSVWQQYGKCIWRWLSLKGSEAFWGHYHIRFWKYRMVAIKLKMEMRDKCYLFAGRVEKERLSEEVVFEKFLKDG